MNEGGYLFDVETVTLGEAKKKFKLLEVPLWTRNKALFIARYLKTFTFVTKHGTYIDAFAGPQHTGSKEESWAAKLVMENEPAWLRNFHLFDQDPKQITHLNKIADAYVERHDHDKNRKVTVTQGNCNEELPAFLDKNPLREKEATFCLLDQRSTECDWATVKTVAQHKGVEGGRKIEVFYFLAQGWIDRTIKSWKNDVEERCSKWWGRDDVFDFLKMRSQERGIAMAERFQTELGYKHAYPFPIQKHGEKGVVMFWMIHASDHDRAPILMMQAYGHVGAGGGLNDPCKQLCFDF